MTNQQWSPAALAHELFTAAQLAPGEGIENAVGRLAALVDAQQPAPSTAVALSDDLRDRLVAISEAVADQDDRAAQAMLREILAAPQPSPAQAGAVPLTDEQIEALPLWKRFVGLWPETRREIVRTIERHHGIKGGQHGTE